MEGLVDTVGEGVSGMNWERTIDTYALSHIGWRAGQKMLGSTGSPVLRPVMTQRDATGEGREAQEGGDICITMTDSCCMAETNITL